MKGQILISFNTMMVPFTFVSTIIIVVKSIQNLFHFKPCLANLLTGLCLIAITGGNKCELSDVGLFCFHMTKEGMLGQLIG